LIKIYKYIGITLFVSGIIGCSGVSLNQRIILSPNDWLMAGGGVTQQNIAKDVVSPPFYLKWTYDCDAGLGYLPMAAADAVVFINTLQGEMHSIDVESGGKIGHLGFLGKDASTTPVIDENNVFVAYAGDNNYSLASYDLVKSEIIWRINLGYIQASPLLYEGFIYTGTLKGKFHKIDKKDGKIIWESNVKSPIHSTPSISNNKAVFGTDDGHIYCINLIDGNITWKIKTGNSVFSAPMIKDDRVYIGSYDSNYYCINLDSGNIKWKVNLKTKIASGTSLFNENSVVFGGIDGILYSLNIASGKINWTFPTKGVITSTPLTSGSNIYFTSFDWHAYCVDGRDGKMLWNYEIEGKGKTSPLIWKNYLFVAADKYLYCFSTNPDDEKK
jgi:outer membrane protein assembly factor BamB